MSENRGLLNDVPEEFGVVVDVLAFFFELRAEEHLAVDDEEAGSFWSSVEGVGFEPQFGGVAVLRFVGCVNATAYAVEDAVDGGAVFV